MENIHITELKNIFESEEFKSGKVIVVDVRTKAEFKGEHIEGTVNYSLDKIDSYKDELEKYDKVYMHCRTGVRSTEACKSLESLGLPNVVTLDGGIEAWKEAGYKTIIGKGVMSIFRQVLIAAGSLVFLGIILYFIFGQIFLIIPLFVSMGLMYGGISDNCYMAKLLAKMPWNQ